MPASAAPAHSTKPVTGLQRIEARNTCHHVRQTSRRHCTSARVLRQYYVPQHLHYPRRYYGRPHYAQFDPYYGYARPFTPDRFYRPYWRPFWY
jgi:hypothetical protein